MAYLDAPVLSHREVRLEPLEHRHEAALRKAVIPGELWQTWYTHIPSPEGMRDAIAQRLAQHAAGEAVPWAIIDPGTGAAVGMTSYLHIEAANRRLEIGSTWIGQQWQGTRINPAAKLLLLTRAFEELGCIAVEFRAHWHNRQSRTAIEKLGAKQDGVLRSHTIFENGTVRDTVVFSIIESEWPTVKHGLEYRLR